MKYKILFSEWEGELNFFEPTEIFKNAGNEKDYNYYLVDNIINKKFMIYYLIEFYNEDFSKSTDKFILKLIDHNVNSFEIDITDFVNYIQIKKDGYITN